MAKKQIQDPLENEALGKTGPLPQPVPGSAQAATKTVAPKPEDILTGAYDKVIASGGSKEDALRAAGSANSSTGGPGLSMDQVMSILDSRLHPQAPTSSPIPTSQEPSLVDKFVGAMKQSKAGSDELQGKSSAPTSDQAQPFQATNAPGFGSGVGFHPPEGWVPNATTPASRAGQVPHNPVFDQPKTPAETSPYAMEDESTLRQNAVQALEKRAKDHGLPPDQQQVYESNPQIQPLIDSHLQMLKMQSDTAREKQRRDDEIEQGYKAQWQSLQAQRAQVRDYLSTHDVDPSRWWNSKSTGQQFMSSIGMVVAGAGAGITGGPNQAFEQINRIADRDIESQRMDLGKRQNMLSDLMAEGHSLESATQMMRSANAEWAATQMQKLMPGIEGQTLSSQYLAQFNQAQAAQFKARVEADKMQAEADHIRAETEKLRRPIALAPASEPGWKPYTKESDAEYRKERAAIDEYMSALSKLDNFNRNSSGFLDTPLPFNKEQKDTADQLKKRVQMAAQKMYGVAVNPGEKEEDTWASFGAHPETWDRKALELKIKELKSAAQDRLLIARKQHGYLVDNNGRPVGP